jgi:2,4-dienoyl-CoA reductase (NADPH2)
MMQLTKLFEPIAIGGMELKNRVVMSAMALGLGNDGKVTDRLKDFYAERARGGVGLIVVGIVSPLYSVSVLPGLLSVYSDELVPGLCGFADLMHACGAKVAMQLSALEILVGDDGTLELVGPSEITIHRNAPKPRPLTVDEIAKIVDAFGEGARRARQAHFDAVELNAHGGGGIIGQFLSARTNKRSDSYGGALENRARFLLECIQSVKRKAGGDYPLLCRLAGADFVEGGNTLEDTKAIARTIEKAGVHAVNVTTGWHEAPVPFVQMSVPWGSWVYLAETVKKMVNIPVIGGTRIPDPRLAEQILAEGRVDLAYIARPLIADPEWLNKARDGRFDEIRPCIACCLCVDGMAEGRSVRCSVNARAGQEAERSITPAEKPKKVLVIGGGPAGMEAARVACLKGHDVILADNRDQLGGQLLVAALPPHKEELGNLTRYLAGEVERLGVRVRLGEEVTVKTVEDVNPDVVVVATGATPIIPDIRGARGKNVAMAIDVLTGRRYVGGNVVVIGGGMTGCETAEFLAEKDRKVTILEMLERIGADIGPATRWVLMGRLRRLGVRMETNTRVEEITDTGVKATRNGSTESIEADSVVLAVGMKANRRLAEELEGKASTIYVIGDSETPGKITEAIERAFLVGCEI